MKITIPAGGPGYSFLDFANHILDHSPVYESRAQMRLGYKVVEAIEAAVKASETEADIGDEDAFKLFQTAAERAPIPKLMAVVEGGQPEPVPRRFFTQFYEAVENAK